MKKEYMDVCETLGWTVTECGDGTTEFRKYSPAGEDFYFCVHSDNLVDEVQAYWLDFDADEHAEMWIKHRGTKGVPSSVLTLAEDAEAIDAMLKELAETLLFAATRAPMDKEEFKQWIYDNYNVPGNNCTLAPSMLDGILDYAESMESDERFDFFSTVFPSLPERIFRWVSYC